MRLFGFEISREKDKEPPVSFAPETKDDGAVNIAAGGAYGQYVDLDGSIRTEAELVNKYRQMAFNPEIDQAIDEIVNEAIVVEEGKETVELILDDLDVKQSFKNMLIEEFKVIQRLLEFDTKPYDIFKAWYRDGRLYYHKIADPKKPDEGVQELRYLDPRKIRKVRENFKKRSLGAEGQQITLIKDGKEYFLYSEKGLFASSRYGSSYGNPTSSESTSAIKIARDSILHCTSGVADAANRMMLSHLHKAIRPLNQLRALEDAVVIYRISRAPERRVFYIDVGNLPKMKAEQYIKEMMTKYKNRLVYDASTGAVRDDRRFLTMLEDFWLPRREGGRGTEIDTLPAGQNLGQMEDVQYFQRKLYKSLNVPISRLEPETTYNVGRATEITRDEVKFSKFIDRLRLKFTELFLGALETNLVMKGVMSPEEWEEIRYKIRFKFLHDNYFSELKESEILMERLNIMTQIEPFLGRHVSNMWVRRNVWRQVDDEIAEIDAEIEAELDMPQYNPPSPEMMAPGEPPPQEAPPVQQAEEVIVEKQEDEPVNNEVDDELKSELVNLLRKENEEDSF